MELYTHSQKESSTDSNDNGFTTGVKSLGTIHFNLDTKNKLFVPSVGECSQYLSLNVQA